MKKFTKICILSLALIALTTTVLTTRAEQGDQNKKVSLTLTSGNNTCVMYDYDFGTTGVAVTAITLDPVEHDLTCEFLENAARKVSLQLADLTANSGGETIGTIPNEKFTFTVAADATPAGAIAPLVASSDNFDIARKIYDKSGNVLGGWESTLTISGVVPAGTPSGEYTGALDLLVQPL